MSENKNGKIRIIIIFILKLMKVTKCFARVHTVDKLTLTFTVIDTSFQNVHPWAWFQNICPKTVHTKIFVSLLLSCPILTIAVLIIKCRWCLLLVHCLTGPG